MQMICDLLRFHEWNSDGQACLYTRRRYLYVAVCIFYDID